MSELSRILDGRSIATALAWKARGLAFALLMAAAAACNGAAVESPTSTPTEGPATPALAEVAAGAVAYFDWNARGGVDYALEGDGGLEWFQYDPASGETTTWAGPGPSQSVIQALAAGTEVQGAIASPSGAVILYERLPEGDVAPDPSGGSPDPFPPYELWMADGQAGMQVRVAANFAGRCGMLERRATWLNDESLVVGECSPYLGLPAFFVADLGLMEIAVLHFTDPNGVDQVQPGQLSVSAQGGWLAFVDIPRTSLWRVPIDEIAAANGGLLTSGNRLPIEGVILSPQWSSVGSQLYYWLSPQYGPDTDACDLELQRIDPDTGSQQTVVTKQSLLTVLGVGDYSSLTRCGTEPDWRLSPDGARMLLRILDTATTDPRLLILSLAGGG